MQKQSITILSINSKKNQTNSFLSLKKRTGLMKAFVIANKAR